MNVYCTLFDSNYLTRGLAMYKSLLETKEDFLIYIFAFDDETKTFFQKANFENVIVVSMKEFETERLLRIKKTRKPNEYCYTCSCFSILYVLMNCHHQEVTYVDADIFFFQKPEILLKEFRDSGKDVMITEHRYAPEYEFYKETSGIYCVQFMTFKNNENSLRILNWWCDRCDEWCYEKYEDGKLGDQKYLDDWLERFQGVHVLQNIGGGVAPWNVRKYVCGEGPRVDGVPVVFYHFHAFKWYSYDEYFPVSNYYISTQVEDFIYKPYLLEMKNSLDYIRHIHDENFSKGFSKINVSSDDGMEVLIEKLLLNISALKTAKYLIIYGAGYTGRIIGKYLLENGIRNFEIAVSDKESTGRICFGKPVRCINDFKSYRDDAIVLIAVGEQYRKMVLANLAQLRFSHVIW